MDSTLRGLKSIGLVPVVKITNASKAVPLAQALVRGGLPCAEVTFRTNAAADAIRAMVEAFPEMIVGAGTVLTTKQVDEAVAAGARFIVSPGFNPEVADYCLERGLTVSPGVNSPSQVEQCLARGLEVIKFFPAENSGGLPFIKALAGPYADVLFMPTGGINPDNLASYTTYDHILACGGTWMVKPALIDSDRFDEIERLCREAVARMLDIRLESVSVDPDDGDEALARLVCDAFGAEFSEGVVEGAGKQIVLSTIDLDRAVAHFERKGMDLDRTYGDFTVKLVQR